MKKADDRHGAARGRPRSFDRDTALERAMEVFWRQGYEATSLNDLTSAMDINPPSLYAAFGDKQRLFLETVERYFNGVGSKSGILADEPTTRGAIERLLEQTATDLTRRGRPAGCMLVTSAINCSAAEVKAALAEHRAVAESRIRACMERGIAAGELPGDTDAAALAKFYSTVIEGMSIQSRDGATRKELLAICAAAMRAWPEVKKPAR